MRKEDCFELGSVVKPHGLKGAVTVFIDADDPNRYKGLDVVFVEIHNTLVPHFIQKTEPKNNGQMIFHFEEFDHVDQANAIAKAKLFLPLAALPKLTGKQFYFHEVIGWDAVDQAYGKIGSIVEFNDQGAQTLMVVNHEGVEILIPLLDEFLVEVNRESSTFNLDLPEGLVEMFTENDGERDE